MTVEEIFNKIAVHMNEGILYHEEMARAYSYLALYGSSLNQFHQQLEEIENYQKLLHYYSTHYYKLLQIENIKKPEIIPNTWYKYTTIAVDTGTKRNALKELMNKWVEWEHSTKKLYENMQHELNEIGEAAAALYIDNLILDVTKELHYAQKKLIELETINYDMTKVIEWQQEMEKKYKKKLGW